MKLFYAWTNYFGSNPRFWGAFSSYEKALKGAGWIGNNFMPPLDDKRQQITVIPGMVDRDERTVLPEHLR